MGHSADGIRRKIELHCAARIATALSWREKFKTIDNLNASERLSASVRVSVLVPIDSVRKDKISVQILMC